MRTVPSSRLPCRRRQSKTAHGDGRLRGSGDKQSCSPERPIAYFYRLGEDHPLRPAYGETVVRIGVNPEVILVARVHQTTLRREQLDRFVFGSGDLVLDPLQIGPFVARPFVQTGDDEVDERRRRRERMCNLDLVQIVLENPQRRQQTDRIPDVFQPLLCRREATVGEAPILFVGLRGDGGADNIQPVWIERDFEGWRHVRIASNEIVPASVAGCAEPFLACGEFKQCRCG